MPLPLTLLRQLQAASPGKAWASLFEHAWNTCSAPLPPEKASSEVTKRDAELGVADLFLATAGWDLWYSYEAVVPRTADVLASWWAERGAGRAVLVLDALSLREVPWLLKGAADRGYTVHQSRVTGAELPANTQPFAAALGYMSRSSLQNNGGAGKGRLTGAVTDSTDLPWEDCAAQINAAQDWLLWHHWPDERLHDLGAPGHGLATLAKEAAEKLSSDGFWGIVHALTTGRRLIITADHGYAASGHFHDTPDPAQARYLKDRLKSGRWSVSAELEPGNWVPPLTLHLKTAHADAALALGRRKWKSQGGYPTLTHGGLSLLEVAVPFIELSRTGGA
ncbi:hypothetical protein ACFY3B_04825 [Micromonospora parva]|uniref:PglZ domain-containing protein n=1 Tax=Micromonospora parva TaxID=1464048 RepID=A0ABW6VMZ2_9ACTN